MKSKYKKSECSQEKLKDMMTTAREDYFLEPDKAKKEIRLASISNVLRKNLFATFEIIQDWMSKDILIYKGEKSVPSLSGSYERYNDEYDLENLYSDTKIFQPVWELSRRYAHLGMDINVPSNKHINDSNCFNNRIDVLIKKVLAKGFKENEFRIRASGNPLIFKSSKGMFLFSVEFIKKVSRETLNELWLMDYNSTFAGDLNNIRIHKERPAYFCNEGEQLKDFEIEHVVVYNNGMKTWDYEKIESSEEAESNYKVFLEEHRENQKSFYDVSASDELEILKYSVVNDHSLSLKSLNKKNEQERKELVDDETLRIYYSDAILLEYLYLIGEFNSTPVIKIRGKIFQANDELYRLVKERLSFIESEFETREIETKNRVRNIKSAIRDYAVYDVISFDEPRLIGLVRETNKTIKPGLKIQKYYSKSDYVNGRHVHIDGEDRLVIVPCSEIQSHVLSEMIRENPKSKVFMLYEKGYYPVSRYSCYLMNSSRKPITEFDHSKAHDKLNFKYLLTPNYRGHYDDEFNKEYEISTISNISLYDDIEKIVIESNKPNFILLSSSGLPIYNCLSFSKEDGDIVISVNHHLHSKFEIIVSKNSVSMRIDNNIVNDFKINPKLKRKDKFRDNTITSNTSYFLEGIVEAVSISFKGKDIEFIEEMIQRLRSAWREYRRDY